MRDHAGSPDRARRAARWLTGAAAAFALIAVGRLTAPSAETTVIASGPAGAAPPRVVYTSTTARLDDRDIDRLRDALRPAAAAPAPAVAPTPSADAPADPARAQADDAGETLIETVVSRGRWTADDRDALAATLIGMSNQGRGRALRTLAMAINAGQVRVDPGVAIF